MSSTCDHKERYNTIPAMDKKLNTHGAVMLVGAALCWTQDSQPTDYTQEGAQMGECQIRTILPAEIKYQFDF